MTSRSFDTAKAKVQWAEKHFGDFKDIVFGRSNGKDTRKTTVVHYDLQSQPNTGPPELFAPSRECRLAFGDAIHQLRASLDHVVYTLVDGLTADPKVLRQIDFPIYASAELFERSRGIRHLERLLPAKQFEAILDAQPYKRTPAAPETDWLWVLSELDNIDKHRTILVVDPRLMTKFLNEDGTMRVVKEKFVRGAHGMPVPPHAPPAPSDTKVEERAIVVVLAETGLRCDNTRAIRVWRDMVAEVKAVIGRFEQLLP